MGLIVRELLVAPLSIILFSINLVLNINTSTLNVWLQNITGDRNTYCSLQMYGTAVNFVSSTLKNKQNNHKHCNYKTK